MTRQEEHRTCYTQAFRSPNAMAIIATGISSTIPPAKIRHTASNGQAMVNSSEAMTLVVDKRHECGYTDRKQPRRQAGKEIFWMIVCEGITS